MLGIPGALLDAELILAHTLRQSRTWLHAHSEDEIDSRRLEIATARLDLRKERVPIAYILGYKEFYGRRFIVTPATLVPRPESETIIELLSQFVNDTTSSLLDVGTGTGCLGITAKLEFPALDVTLSDISPATLAVAKENAQHLQATVTALQSDLLSSCKGSFDIILANLPYVDRTWDTSPELLHEPQIALYADDEGLALIFRLIDEAMTHSNTGSHLFIEADPCQHERIISYALSRNYIHSLTQDYIVVFSRT